MIKNIFIPQTIGSYYIFTQKIIGFYIGKNFVQATLIRASQEKRVIEKFIQERINDNDQQTYQERVSAAIVKILSTIGSYDLIYTSLSSALIIFKELTLPFTQLSKIKMVLPYEIEPTLPFSLENAVIDCIITRLDKAVKQSTLLVAAVKKEVVLQQLQFFEEAGVQPQKVTIDLFELYALYLSIPSYREIMGIVALVDVNLYSTRIALIYNGELKFIRPLNRGIMNLAQDAHEQTLVFKKEKLRSFMDDIQFTMQGYKEKQQETVKEKIIITGHGAEIQGFVEVLEAVCTNNCELFHPSKVLQAGNISFVQGQTIPQSFVISLSTALDLPLTHNFNLSQQFLVAKQEKLLGNQLIALFLLVMLIIGSLALDNWYTKRALQIEVTSLTEDTLNKLKSQFSKVKQTKGKLTLAKANSVAEEEVAKEEDILSKLLRKNKPSFLSYLEELTQRIDRQALDLQLDKLTISEATHMITLEGQVKNYEQLGLLEQSLRRSKLFKFLGPTLQKTTFEIKLGINEEYWKK